MEKIGSISKKSVRVAHRAAVYQDGELYGLLTPDGKSDTGAKYYGFDVVGEYFSVVTELPAESADVAAKMNLISLVDAQGKEILSGKYAKFVSLNRRYMTVMTVSGATDSKEEAIGYTSDNAFSLVPDEGDQLFAGTLKVYDLKAGAFVEGAVGTKSYSNFDAYGPFLRFTDDAGETKYIDATGSGVTGQIVAANRNLAAVETTAEGKVYNASGDVLFTYNPNEYTIYDCTEDDNLIGQKSISGTKTYFVMDQNGNALTTDFNDYINACGNFVICNDQVFNAQGEQVLDGYHFISADELRGNIFEVRDGSKEAFFGADGTIFWQGESTDEIKIGDFSVRKKTEDYKSMYYSLKDADFTVEGDSTGLPFATVTTDGDGRYDLFDLRTNNTMIEGYEDYIYSPIENGVCYVYAKKAEGGYDVFAVR